MFAKFSFIDSVFLTVKNSVLKIKIHICCQTGYFYFHFWTVRNGLNNIFIHIIKAFTLLLHKVWFLTRSYWCRFYHICMDTLLVQVKCILYPSAEKIPGNVDLFNNILKENKRREVFIIPSWWLIKIYNAIYRV